MIILDELILIIDTIKSSWLLIINGLFIIIATVFLVYRSSVYFVDKRMMGAFRKVLSDNIDEKAQEIQIKKKLLRKSQKYSSIEAKLSFFEKMDIKYIDKSNIKSYYSKISIFHILAISAVIVCIIFYIFEGVFKSPFSSAMMGSVSGLIPFVVLDIMGKHNSQKIRRYLPDFIAILYRWSLVREDLVYSFEKSLDSGIREPLRTYVREMITQINRGMEVEMALEIMEYKVDNEHFTTFINNVKFAYKSRGNIPNLLKKLEGESYKLEEEFNRRKISTFRDRIIISVCLVLVLIFTYLFMKLNPDAMKFYTVNTVGRGLMVFFAILYFLAFWISTGITKFNY
jgi:Flp pilus assembly protein TadB